MVSDLEPALIPNVGKSPVVHRSRNFKTNLVNGNCTGRFGAAKTMQLFGVFHCYLNEQIHELLANERRQQIQELLANPI
jgi:hypothetical protein